MVISMQELVRSAIEAKKTSLDWTLITEICERANSSYTEAKSAVNELDTALKQRIPASIELCISISSTLVYNCNDEVKKLIISKPFLRSLVAIITSKNYPNSTKTQCHEFIHRLSTEFGENPDFRYVRLVQKDLEDSSYVYAPSPVEKRKYDEEEKEREDIELAIALSLSQSNSEPPPTAKSLPLFKAKALYHFEPRDQGDLRLAPGDLIDVTDTSTYTEWWKGCINDDNVGFFPSNFVEVVHRSSSSEAQILPLIDRIRKLNQQLVDADKKDNSSLIANEDIRREFLEIISQKSSLLAKLEILSKKNKDMMSKLRTIDEFVDLCANHLSS